MFFYDESGPLVSVLLARSPDRNGANAERDEKGSANPNSPSYLRDS